MYRIEMETQNYPILQKVSIVKASNVKIDSNFVYEKKQVMKEVLLVSHLN